MTRINRPIVFILGAALVLSALVVAGCSKSASADAIARVNGTDILKSSVDKQIAQMKKASPATFEATQGAAVEQQYRAQILDGLIDLSLVQAAGKDLGVSVTTKQIDDYVAGLVQQYGSQAALDTAMKSAGFDMAMLREQISNSLLMQAVSSKVASGAAAPTAAQIKVYYDANKTQFSTPAQVHATHILIATADKTLAESLLSQVKNGGDFVALAKKYSTDPGSKAAGGDLGWAGSSAYVTEFAGAVDAMKVNEVRLVQTQFGWHIIKLLGKRPAAQQTLAEATPAATQALTQNASSDAFAKYLAGLRKKAKIEILDANLKKLIDAANASAASTTTK
ncbi:MAG TPA: peptidylprolyl isomerase [Coriobacteriia bacterium]